MSTVRPRKDGRLPAPDMLLTRRFEKRNEATAHNNRRRRRTHSIFSSIHILLHKAKRLAAKESPHGRVRNHHDPALIIQVGSKAPFRRAGRKEYVPPAVEICHLPPGPGNERT
jgi:hypothetical protein